MTILNTTLASGIGALHCPAAGIRRAGLVVVQEIFGVNDNIAALAAQFASQGFEVLAPDYFGRVEPGFVADHDGEGVHRGLTAVRATPWDQVAGDTQAAIDQLTASGGPAGAPVFVTGFCWGGTVSWLAAQRCRGLAAASGFYGRLINTLLDAPPLAPVQLHYGERDSTISPQMVAEVRAAFPAVPVHVWPAGHGFLSDRGHDHDPVVAAAAWQSTLDFFATHGLPPV